MIAPALAFEEQHRAEGMVARAAEIASIPSPSPAESLNLSLYQDCARAAFESAAAFTDQPAREW